MDGKSRKVTFSSDILFSQAGEHEQSSSRAISDGNIEVTITEMPKLVITQIPIPLSIVQSAVDAAAIQNSPSSTTRDKILLPKLPPGVPAPSKIILIQGDGMEASHVQILDTTRARVGVSESDHRLKILTGAAPLPQKLLPKPDNYVFQRPTKSAVPKIAIPKQPPSLACATTTFRSPGNATSATRIGSVRKSKFHGDKEDAMVGFDDTALMNDATFVPDGTSAARNPFLNGVGGIPVSSLEAAGLFPTTGKCLLPKPGVELGTVANGARGQTSKRGKQKDPKSDEFRPPKRRRSTYYSVPAPPQLELVSSPGNIDPNAPDSGVSENEDSVPKGKRKGRPSHLKRTVAQLLVEIDRDCLALASDGINLKCLACNCLLTQQGWGYARQVMKHLNVVQSHRSRYELWKLKTGGTGHNDPSSIIMPDEIPEAKRVRGRYKKTGLDYYNEMKNPWLELSADGQTLSCSACKMDLLSPQLRAMGSDIQRHLTRDPEHIAIVENLVNLESNYHKNEGEEMGVEGQDAEEQLEAQSGPYEEYEGESSAHEDFLKRADEDNPEDGDVEEVETESQEEEQETQEELASVINSSGYSLEDSVVESVYEEEAQEEE